MSLYPLAHGLLFSLDPERAHAVTLAALDRLERSGLRRVFVNPVAALPTKALGLSFPNPVGLGAGLDKNGEHIDALFGLGFGFVEIGTVTPRPQPAADATGPAQAASPAAWPEAQAHWKL